MLRFLKQVHDFKISRIICSFGNWINERKENVIKGFISSSSERCSCINCGDVVFESNAAKTRLIF